MFIVGHSRGVPVWYILWGGNHYCAEIYKTAYGVRAWLLNPAYADLPGVQVAQGLLTPQGFVQEKTWTREEFLEAKVSEE